MQRSIYGSGPSVRLRLQTGDGASIRALLAEDPGSAVGSDDETALERLSEVIDAHRERLANLDSLLGCLAIAMEYGADTDRPPFYPDVVQMSRDLVLQAMRSLDPAIAQPATKSHARKNAVKDEPRTSRSRSDRISGEAGTRLPCRLVEVSVERDFGITE
jgi:hypothetical protein